MAGNDIRGRWFRPNLDPDVDPVVIHRIPIKPTTTTTTPTTIVVPSHVPTTTTTTPTTIVVPSHLPPTTTTTTPTIVVPSHTIAINPGIVKLGNTPLADVIVRVHDHGGQLVDPSVAHAIDQLGAPRTVTPRDQIKLPTLISPTATPTDGTVFDDPGDASKHYSLCGGFQLAFVPSGAGSVKWVELRPGAEPNTYVLEVHLDRHPIANLTPIPDSIPVNTRCILHATINTAVREWDFSEVEVNGMQWTLRLKIANADPAVVAAQLGAIYTAMTADKTDAQLIIRRSLSLAVQTTGFAPGKWVPRVAMMMRPIRPIGIDDPPPDPIGPRPFPHPPHPIPIPPPPPRPTPVAGYDVKDIGVDSIVPFAFNKDLDRNVFAKLLQQTQPQAPTWTRVPLPWQPDPSKQAELKTYYQDPSVPGIVYFVPDEFRVHRSGEAPFAPLLKAGVLDGGARIALSYAAIPIADDARLADAAPKLKDYFKLASAPRLFPFWGHKGKLRLNLPNGDGAGGPGYVEQPAAEIRTEVSVTGSVTLGSEDFKQVFDAIINDSTDLMIGEVSVDIDDENVPIPFTARATRFAGDVLALQAAVKDGQIVITAQNAIESPVVVSELPIAITQGDSAIDAALTSVTPVLPVTLKPNEAITFVYTPAKDVGDISVDADQSSVSVQPDSGAILDTILDPVTPGQATRAITVHVARALFAPQPNKPQLVQVQVDFPDQHATASFAAPGGTDNATDPLMTATVQLHVPLRDFILGKLTGASTTYTYVVRLNYANGTSTKGDPQVDTIDDLFALIPGA